MVSSIDLSFRASFEPLLNAEQQSAIVDIGAWRDFKGKTLPRHAFRISHFKVSTKLWNFVPFLLREEDAFPN